MQSIRWDVLFNMILNRWLDNAELRYIAYASMFAIVWFLLILPNIDKFGFTNSSPYTQFLIFNVGIFIFLQFFIKSQASGINGTSLRVALGLVLLFTALDIMIPPMLVGMDGSLLQTSAVLGKSSADYVVGYFYTQLGLSGVLVFIMTYIVTPILMMVLAAKLIPNFVNRL